MKPYMRKIFFITGVNGVGKSSIMPGLRALLPESDYVILDFDARGVPDNAGRDWRISETRHWISEGGKNAAEGKSTVICGFIKPSDLGEYALAQPGSPEIVLILLHAGPEIIRQRLIGRYSKDGVFDASQTVIGKPINVFIDGNVWFAEKLRDEFAEKSLPIIDTSAIGPEEAARQVADIIMHNK